MVPSSVKHWFARFLTALLILPQPMLIASAVRSASVSAWVLYMLLIVRYYEVCIPGKYGRCSNVPFKWRFPLSIRVIPGSCGNTQALAEPGGISCGCCHWLEQLLLQLRDATSTARCGSCSTSCAKSLWLRYWFLGIFPLLWWNNIWAVFIQELIIF